MSDPGKYRSKEEVEKYKQEFDPIERLRAQMFASGLVKEDDLKPIETEVKSIVAEATDFATQSPEPDPSELWTDVLIEGSR
jgi:pyruvate dehydrogenase E1 component alpha subunit